MAHQKPAALSFHSPNANLPSTLPFLVDCESCEFIAGTGVGINVRPIAKGVGDTLRLVGCTLASMSYGDDTRWDIYEPGDVTSNRAQIRVIGHADTAFTFDNTIAAGAAAGQAYEPKLTGFGGAVTIL